MFEHLNIGDIMIQIMRKLHLEMLKHFFLSDAVDIFRDPEIFRSGALDQ